MTTDEPLPDRCGAECRDGGYCENYPKGDSDRCRMHGSDGGAPEGDDNGSYEHGAFSDHFRSDLTEDEEAALENAIEHLRGISDERSLAAEVAAEALMKYKRAGDDRFLREARQWFSEFNLIENTDNVNVEGSGIIVSTESNDDS